MAAFQQKANDLHSYIREIESKEKNYRRFKVIAAVLTFIFTLAIVSWVWIVPGSINQLISNLSLPSDKISYETFNRDKLDIFEAETALRKKNTFLLIQSESATDTIENLYQLVEYAKTHDIDTSGLAKLRNTSSLESVAYTRVEKMPYFPGGKVALARYLQSQLVYPQEARSEQIEGNVQVRFVIQPDGSITNVEIVEGIGFGCDEEAMRLVSEMPQWVPGVQNNEKVPVYKALAIKFQLL
ncbi:MAG: energy transducer TonB [Bacteroidota bacterium]